MSPILRDALALVGAALVCSVPAHGAGVELDAADVPRYEEANNLIQSWPGYGDQLERAFKILVEVGNRNPRSAHSLAGLAELKYRLFTNGQGTAAEVVQLAERAVRLDSDNAYAQVAYSKIMLGQGQVDVAARAAEQAMRLAPDLPEAMIQKAGLERHARHYEAAEGWYRKAIGRLAHQRRKANIFFRIGEMYDQKETKTPADIERATEAFVSAAELAGDSIPTLHNAATFLYRNTERFDQAIDYLNRALKIGNYENGRVALGLAQFYKWGHATLHPEKYRNAKDKPWDPEKITSLTGVKKEFAFAMNPVVEGTPYATIAMLKLDMIKDVDVFPEDCECPENALIASAHSNHLEVVRMLVAKGANVNVVDLKYGATALRYAVRFQNLDMARLLLEHGARVNVEDKHGKLLVEYAIIDAKPNDARVLQLLLEKGGDADAVSRTGSPLVAVAVVAGNPAALELLLGRYKADPNVRLSGERGDPILSLAAAQSHADGTRMVGMLLQAGANPWVRYGGSDLINSLRGSKEAYAHAGDVPLKVKAAQTAMLREIDASIALLEEARRRVPKPARY